MSQEVKTMRIRMLPKSSLARWSVGLAAAFILLSILFAILTRLGGEPGPFALIFIANIVIGLSFIAALITGLISMIKSNERSVLVFLSVLVAFGALFYFLNQFLFTH
jgi:Zn-dependent protease